MMLCKIGDQVLKWEGCDLVRYAGTRRFLTSPWIALHIIYEAEELTKAEAEAAADKLLQVAAERDPVGYRVARSEADRIAK